MRASVLQENLAKGLSIVTRAAANRTNLPVLQNVLLSTEDARLRLAATNLEMTIVVWIGAKIDGDGATTLPAKTFSDLVNNLSPERVDLSLDVVTQTVNVRCGGTTSNIKGIDASEFPLIPTGEGGRGVAIPGKILKEMIQQTVFAAAKEDNRPILTGVFMEFDGSVLTMACADGYRLAVRTAELETTFERPVIMVVPSRSMSEVARIISDEDNEVLITFPDERNQVIFHMRNVDVSSQLLEGKFPDFGAIIPRSYVTKTTLYTADLLNACKRAEIFARDNSNNAKFIVQPPETAGEPGIIRVAGISTERGDNEGMLDAQVNGEALNISFNIKYLIDVLNVINEERVEFESNGTNTPGVIRPEGRDDFISVIMPMSVNR